MSRSVGAGKDDDMTVLQRLMLPANAVCDRLGITNEHERGMMRMLVNMGLCTALAVIAVYLGWKILA
jgi:hypothetical protein